jgi:hypothetical protein
MDCQYEFSRRELGFFIAYTEDGINTVFRYRPYSRKMDKHRLWTRARRHGFTIENPIPDEPEYINCRIQYSTIYRTTIPWEWYSEPSFFADIK